MVHCISWGHAKVSFFSLQPHPYVFRLLEPEKPEPELGCRTWHQHLQPRRLIPPNTLHPLQYPGGVHCIPPDTGPSVAALPSPRLPSHAKNRQLTAHTGPGEQPLAPTTASFLICPAAAFTARCKPSGSGCVSPDLYRHKRQKKTPPRCRYSALLRQQRA